MVRRDKPKVYGWMGYRYECPPAPNGNRQTREICAATSIAKLCDILGCKRSDLLNLSETGNEQETRLAMAEPGIVFWRPNDHRGAPLDESWTRAKGR